MLADPIGIPTCFSSGDRSTDDPTTTSVTRSGQNVIMSIYKTKIRNQTRLITITWCRNVLLLHGLSVSISDPSKPESEPGSSPGSTSEYTCKVEMKPWYFWRKQGSKRFAIDNEGKTMLDVFWDLRSAKFVNGETEPSSDYYVAVLFESEFVLLIGDMRNDAFKKTGCGPGLTFCEPVLVSKKEHVFGKKRFFTKVKFHEKGKFHDIIMTCKNNNNINNNFNGSDGDGSGQEMEVRVDGKVVINVKHLEWKFRGNECINVSNKLRVEVYWDVHDWLFSVGLRNGLFIFKPILPISSSMLVSPSSSSLLSSETETDSSGSSGDGVRRSEGSEFCLFLYAWKIE